MECEWSGLCASSERARLRRETAPPSGKTTILSGKSAIPSGQITIWTPHNVLSKRMTQVLSAYQRQPSEQVAHEFSGRLRFQFVNHCYLEELTFVGLRK